MDLHAEEKVIRELCFHNLGFYQKYGRHGLNPSWAELQDGFLLYNKTAERYHGALSREGGPLRKQPPSK